MTDHDAELRAAADEPSKAARTASWLWERRRTLAPILGVLLGAICPHLGWAAGPCAVVGDLVRASVAP